MSTNWLSSIVFFKTEEQMNEPKKTNKQNPMLRKNEEDQPQRTSNVSKWKEKKQSSQHRQNNWRKKRRKTKKNISELQTWIEAKCWVCCIVASISDRAQSYRTFSVMHAFRQHHNALCGYLSLFVEALFPFYFASFGRSFVRFAFLTFGLSVLCYSFCLISLHWGNVF